MKEYCLSTVINEKGRLVFKTENNCYIATNIIGNRIYLTKDEVVAHLKDIANLKVSGKNIYPLPEVYPTNRAVLPIPNLYCFDKSCDCIIYGVIPAREIKGQRYFYDKAGVLEGATIQSFERAKKKLSKMVALDPNTNIYAIFVLSKGAVIYAGMGNNVSSIKNLIPQFLSKGSAPINPLDYLAGLMYARCEGFSSNFGELDEVKKLQALLQ